MAGHSEPRNLKSRAFRSYTQLGYYNKEKKPINGQALQDALATCEAKAQFGGKPQEVFLRIGKTPTEMYLDLSNDQWEAVQVTSKGWDVTADPDVKFRCSRGMKPSGPHQ